MNSDRDLWQTSDDLFQKLDDQYFFTFDCCANEKNAKCELFSSNFEKEGELLGPVWMNPPFSIAQSMFSHFFKIADSGVAIFRCDNMEMKVWQDVILKKADWVFIPKGRVRYKPFDIPIRGGMTRFPFALIGFGVEPPRNFEGTTLLIKRFYYETRD